MPELFEMAAQALGTILQPGHLLMVGTGIAIGIVVGIIPGLSGTTGMALLLPFIYGMEPTAALALLIGMVAVVHTADSIPAVLLGIPGTSGAAATILDGYPLSQQGQAGRALGAAFFSSMIGGLIGAAVAFVTLPIARPLVLALGSPELFMLSLLGLAMVGVLSGRRPILGIVAAAMGLMIGAIGAAPAAPVYRYSFGVLYLYDGVPLPVVALGLFALPELFDLLIAREGIASGLAVGKGWMVGVRDVIRERWLVVRCSAIGALIGFIPGIGGSVVDWISYAQAVQSAPDRSQFGKGDIRGVIGPESSNNAKEGGALIPTLLFGIPGSGTTAVLLGGFILLGLQPGPQMLGSDLDVTLGILWTLALANVIGTAACLLPSQFVARLTTVPATRLFPFIFVIILMGAYQSTRSWGDLIAFLVIGLIGWVMKSLGWPRPALLIGFVLAIAAERYLWLSWSRYEWEWISRPGVIIIALLTVAMAVAGTRLKNSMPAEIVPAGDDNIRKGEAVATSSFED